MIMWGFPVLGCALLVSALLLRRWPLAALAVTLGGSVASMVLEPRPIVALIVVACAAGLEICYIAATRSRRVSVTGAAMACAGLLIPLLAVPSLAALRGGTVGSAGPPAVTIAVPLFTIIAWLIGHSIRQAQARAELVRVQAAAQAAMEERLRIARELHDMVAHSIGIIAIQAGSGRRVFDARPSEAREALAAIEATSRETLSGLRRMVTGLRRAEPEPGSWLAPLGPAPGLADIDRLAATALDAGVRVEVDVDWRGSREPLPADIDLSAFRTIQEAVTNVVRHARTDQCRVSIGQQDGQLSIEVTDSGRGGSTAGTGYGLTGMRERAALLGGDFSAGPRPGGGFRVVAAGDAIIALGVTRRLIAQFTSQPSPGPKPRELTGITDREREVLKLVGLGMSNAEIAAALYITVGTAKTHVARLLAKLGARDRVQLVITAYQADLLDT